MVVGSEFVHNRLLCALPRRDLERLAPDLERVDCPYREVLVDADGSLDHVYFPNHGVVSVVGVYGNGDIIEMATIGREGTTGIQDIFGARASSVRFLVQVPGTAARLKRKAFDRALKDIPAFRDLMFAYLHAFLEQIMISAACNGAHSVKQRLARWLLMMRDRHDKDDLPITQDLLAEMLGVHRPTVTHSIRALQRAGMIELERKLVRIKSRDALQETSCECYRLIRQRTAFHLPKTYPE